MRNISELLDEIRDLKHQQDDGADVTAQLEQAQRELDVAKHLKETRGGSRFVGQNADTDLAAVIAAGGSVKDGKLLDGSGNPVGGTVPVGGPAVVDNVEAGKFLRDVVAAKSGDPHAQQRLKDAKAWAEGTPSAGGYLVNPTILPGYLTARRASAPLRDRCQVVKVESDEVWVNTEGNTLTVDHVAEAATKPDTTGTVGQKVSTVFKVAGTSTVSDELLNDSNGNAAQLIQTQFGQQVGIKIDSTIISGTGTGQPTGIRNAAGVNAQAVDGQGGQALYDSIQKALSRLAGRFYNADTVAIHPRDLVKFDLALDDVNRYLFEGGLGSKLGGKLVLDANIPTNLGGGTNETVMIVGEFGAGAMFFDRQPLTIESSRDAGFRTDETVFRGVERYGFAVVQPGAFEVLTGIQP